MSRLTRIFEDPTPLRFVFLRALDRRIDFLNYSRKLAYGAIDRPQYGHCMLHAARLARSLGHSRISVIEFGVAGGNGLVAMEEHAEHIRQEVGIHIEIYGFDTGIGMPASTDYRDIPYLWQPGDFRMDIQALKDRLKLAKLRIGPVEETVPNFFKEESPPPIGFIAFDLDYYSSTVAAFRIFDNAPDVFLPRTPCYFDDIVGDIDFSYNEFTGELLAIKEFNKSHERVKLAPVQGLRFYGTIVPGLWHEQIFAAHFFDHPDYLIPTSKLTQLPLHTASKRTTWPAKFRRFLGNLS